MTRFEPDSKPGMTTTALALVVVLAVVAIAGGYFGGAVLRRDAGGSASGSISAVTSSADSSSVTLTTDSASSSAGASSTTQSASSSQAVSQGSGQSTTTSSITSQASATASSTSQSSSSSISCPTVNLSSFVVPSGGSEVNIPPGIQDTNAKQLGITFKPVNLTVVTGVNNTIYFVDSDVQDNLGHILESSSWPTNGQVFDFWILPNQVCSVTLTTPGLYEYNCEWHPVWMSGTIKVVAG